MIDLRTQVIELIDPYFASERQKGHRLYSSLEGENPGGSIKDHLVKGELTECLTDGRLLPGDWVSELSAGSTAASLAYYCNQLGLNCALFLPSSTPSSLVDKLSQRVQEVHLLEMATAYQEYGEQVARRQFFAFDQLFDTSKKRHYQGFARQVQRAIPGSVDLVVGAVGTGHSLLGTTAYIGRETLAVSAEPGSNWKVAGCRNILVDRYGANDHLTVDSLAERIIIHTQEEVYSESQILTDHGAIEVGETFALVLAAAKKALASRKECSVFLIGAKSHLSEVIGLSKRSA